MIRLDLGFKQSRGIINHIGVSGGKDSTALLLWAVYESGYPKDSIVATFCDTGNEADVTYRQIEMLSTRVHPIETIKPPLDFFELAKKKKRFPSVKARFCTSELKVLPTQSHIHGLISRGYTVVAHSGVRRDESLSRAALPARDYDPGFLCECYRPLIDWGIEDIWAIHDRYSIPVNPLYKMGATRVGCLPCIINRKRELTMIARNFPEVVERLAAAEESIDTVNGFSSFFAMDRVPITWRSKDVTLANGEIVKVPTARDVFNWAQTAWGGRQFQFDFMLDADPDSAVCPSGRGMCE
jgi:3'-phosphoadenosine 5'-phosphosulfate sulfotransferase (PAPS reductase)/FAD synthetase